MRKPKMILFDYGQTLADESAFDARKGLEAVMQYAVSNPHGVTALDLREKQLAINEELGRYIPGKPYTPSIEVPTAGVFALLLDSFGVKLSISGKDLDLAYWDGAMPVTPVPGIAEFLEYLEKAGIRSGVISNISYCEEAVRERIARILPKNRFEFVLTSCRYLFRKPKKYMFETALELAGLPAEEIWYCGDRYEPDVLGPRTVGMMPVWYQGALKAPPREEDLAEDVLQVKSWDALRAILEEAAE